MDNSLQRRYYTPWQICVGAILGSPLAAGYFASRDHKLFGAPKKAAITLLVSCFIVAALLGLGAVLPKGASGTVWAALVAGAYRWYADGAFSADISRRRSEGWTPHSWWRVVGLSLAILLAMFACGYLVLLALAAR
jgi:hypothetical protein